MKKRLIGLLSAGILLISSFSANAVSVSTDQLFTDDFSNKILSEENWRYSNVVGNSVHNPISSSDGLGKVEDGILKIASEAGSKKSFYLVFDEPVQGNVKATFKMQFPTENFLYIYATGSKSESVNTSDLGVASFWPQNGTVTVKFYNPYNGTTGITLPNHTADKWYNVCVNFYDDAQELGVSIDGSDEYRSPFSKSHGNFTGEDEYKGLTRFGFNLPANNSLNIDDIKIEIDVPLELKSMNIQEGEVNVDVDKEIEVVFNKVMQDVSAITLKKSDNSTVECDVDINGKTVTVKPKQNLSSLTGYILTIPSSVKATDGKTLDADKNLSFTTKLVNDLSIDNASFASNIYTATIKNSTSSPINATARLTIYKLVNGVKQYVGDIIDIITVDGEYSYSKTVTDIPADYEVSLSILDENLNPLCAEEAFDKNGRKVNLSDVVSSVGNSIDYTNGVVSVAKNIGTLSYVYKVIEVKNESNEVIYFDQISTNTNGSCKFDFVPAYGLLASNYSITINGTEMQQPLNETLAVDYSQFAVSVTKPEIKGNLTGGEEISAEYTFNSVIGEDEGDTAYEWLISDNSESSYSPITNANAKPYVIDYNDENKYIKVRVKPKTKLGLAMGSWTESDAVQIKPLPTATSVSISGSAITGNLLTGTYSYSHKNGAAQSGTTYKWLISDTITGQYTEVGNGLTYSVREADAEKYIKFAVIPGCDTEPKIGKQAESTPIYITKNSGNGGGGDSGGSIFGGGFVGSLDYKNPEIIVENEDDIESAKPNFSDTEGHWAKKEIDILFDRQIVNGDENGNFNPDNNVTRAEFTAMIVRLLGLSEQEYIRMFEDVTTEDWYSKSIQTAVSHGIVSGDGKNFRPNDNITREEMAIIIIGAYELKLGESQSGESNIKDAEQISGWAIEAVEKTYTLGLINGFEDGSFSPKTSATRAQSAAVMVRLLNCIEEV